MKPSASLGCRPIAAKTCGKRSAAASASWQVAAFVPTVSIRLTPASTAAATRSASLGLQTCRWVWLSITDRPSVLGKQLRELLDRAEPAGLRAGVLQARRRCAERGEQLRRALGDPGVQEDGDDAQ